MKMLSIDECSELTLLWSTLLLSLLLSQTLVATSQPEIERREIRNGTALLTIVLEAHSTLTQRLSIDPGFARAHNMRDAASIESDGDFGLDLMYTDWRAPGKQNNADNPVMLTMKDFDVLEAVVQNLPKDRKEITILLKGKETPLNVRLTYRLEAGRMYIRKKIAVSDTTFGHHYLRELFPIRSHLRGVTGVLKRGDFGQPVAIEVRGGGGFFGLEYPAGVNLLTDEPAGYMLSCGEHRGVRIGKSWIESAWAVEAITPDPSVKRWFFEYLNDVRVSPLRPYTLYNSWYDLRSPDYPHIPPENVMNEKSARKMINLLREKMIDRHGIQLDAFVLDDGWDVYTSDWELRKDQFPNGLKPLADELKRTNTALGVWLGPTGGYSFRKQRIEWMKAHDYELVGDQMCVAGTKYHALLKKRVTDFASNDGVGYFKWDGIQFSCSEPDHGHAIDIYSRRAVLDSLGTLCSSVRENNPSMFLNITSGTWLSPWWLAYANTIWMDGEDYGFADVPSIRRRDAAITYRDFVLYEDFKMKDLWFPVANLMTHGVIKGKLENLGTAGEPLDVFTDDALLYVARGISMYELYISPDIISEGEWNALATSIAWAKDRFPILSSTEMIGGNPLKREPYGYAHFQGSSGIIAVRNPFIEPGSITVELTPSEGLDPGADSLVIERVYPTHWVSPQLRKAGDRIELPLEGYETAIYEMFPIRLATVPLVGGVVFDAPAVGDGRVDVTYHPGEEPARILNPGFVKSVSVSGSLQNVITFRLKSAPVTPFVTQSSVVGTGTSPRSIALRFRLSDSASNTTIAMLLTPDDTLQRNTPPSLQASICGKTSPVESEVQEGRSRWFVVNIQPGEHFDTVTFNPGKDRWVGTASIWLIGRQRERMQTVRFEMPVGVKQRPSPPKAWPEGEIKKNVLLGKTSLVLEAVH